VPRQCSTITKNHGDAGNSLIYFTSIVFVNCARSSHALCIEFTKHIMQGVLLKISWDVQNMLCKWHPNWKVSEFSSFFFLLFFLLLPFYL